MMRMTFRVSAALATVGTVLAVAGIYGGDYRTLPTGLVLLLAAGVFAILSLSARRGGDVPTESASDQQR